MSSEFEKTRQLARGQIAFVLWRIKTGAIEPDAGVKLPVRIANLLATLATDMAAAEADLANEKAVAEKALAAQEAEFQGRVHAFEAH
jgi:hypothetical protein